APAGGPGGPFRDGGLCLFNVSDAPMIVDLNLATDCPSQLFEALLQRYRTGQTLWVTLGKWHQHADTAHTLALLRTRRERPRGHAAQRGHEFPPSDDDCHTRDLAKTVFLASSMTVPA